MAASCRFVGERGARRMTIDFFLRTYKFGLLTMRSNPLIWGIFQGRMNAILLIRQERNSCFLT